MGIVFAIELLLMVLLFIYLNFHLARKRMAEKVHHGHGEHEAVMRAVHAHHMSMGYTSLGVAMILYLWLQGIDATFAIIYGAALFIGCLLYAYSVLCYEVKHKDDYLFRKVGGSLALLAIFASALTAFIALL
ncbi:MAG: hypothetical protein COV52_02610 [Gammaproteobacteria bacterium CG11_big_fil_rev_8_21_14_0_20_46_22]|nr:MAG: hypothetical protein COW05_08650 [Gammaproteobacteria bacterium CG12_big_fil_rev_8_21_14_0_65_46_12]PIR11671.1 MAG: hypothetical protein COV52_02610 [Gammaproteobacteria bacterium CG11_big_fil_rev_8_21_14_0_20_46_22]